MRTSKIMTEASSRNTSPCVPVEEFLEKNNSFVPPRSDYCVNEHSGKKIKYDHEQHSPQDIYCAKSPMIEDDCEAFGLSVAAQLRQMSKFQKLLAQRLISEICFRGQLNALQVNTTLTSYFNPGQQYQHAPFSNPVRVYYNGGTEYAMQYNAVQQQTRMPANMTLSNNIQYQAPNMNHFQEPHQVPTSMDNIVNASESVG